ncbi:hypothetical protein HRI_002439400 [Hibiscus trionum]|uniref:Uncharacterized protein n=1 Tax=Hibiscus trionum TaxID=183268 RepID=A0A9W7I349_HIBTR|nr:hypothetical protein HRI_002439400 [Hibiscus trionum]
MEDDVVAHCQFHLHSVFYAYKSIPTHLHQHKNNTLSPVFQDRIQGDSRCRRNGSYWGLKLLNFMALRDIRAMFGEKNGYIGVGKTLQGVTVDNYSKRRVFGMEYESDWTKNRLSSALTAQVIRSATSLMPWCCKIPIGDGFHEFL